MSTALTTLTTKLAATLNMGDGSGLLETLKATAFKGQVSDAQMTALMVVANQYGLNPWTKEIYAFPDRNNGIVPVVGVDGWSRIINNHPAFDGIDFEQDEESCTCIIFRKDRNHPTKVTEWMAECRRDGVGPWKSHPKRMLRHKALIQCARMAFGYGGIYDQDEAERIVEAKGTTSVIDATTGEVVQPRQPAPLPPLPAERFAKNIASWQASIDRGGNVADLIAMLSSKYTLSEEQLERIEEMALPPNNAEEPTQTTQE
jgi:phage recombination protein Bet